MRNRNGRLRRMTALAGAVCMAAASAAGCADVSTPAAETASPAYSGEQMFSAIFFGEGSAAASVARLRSAPVGHDAAGSSAEAVAALQAADPGFFGRFAADLRSGSHERVSAALDAGTRQIQGVLDEYNNEQELPGPDEPIGMCLIAFCHVVTQGPGTSSELYLSSEEPLERDFVVAVVTDAFRR